MNYKSLRWLLSLVEKKRNREVTIYLKYNSTTTYIHIYIYKDKKKY